MWQGISSTRGQRITFSDPANTVLSSLFLLSYSMQTEEHLCYFQLTPGQTSKSGPMGRETASPKRWFAALTRANTMHFWQTAALWLFNHNSKVQGCFLWSLEMRVTFSWYLASYFQSLPCRIPPKANNRQTMQRTSVFRKKIIIKKTSKMPILIMSVQQLHDKILGFYPGPSASYLTSEYCLSNNPSLYTSMLAHHYSPRFDLLFYKYNDHWQRSLREIREPQKPQSVTYINIFSLSFINLKVPHSNHQDLGWTVIDKISLLWEQDKPKLTGSSCWVLAGLQRPCDKILHSKMKVWERINSETKQSS